MNLIYVVRCLSKRILARLEAGTRYSRIHRLHCTENSKQIFPEMKLRGIFTHFYIHVSVSDLYIPTHDRSANAILLYSKIDGPIVGIYKSLTDTRMQKLGTVSILGIFVSNFRGSVVVVSLSFVLDIEVTCVNFAVGLVSSDISLLSLHYNCILP